MSALLVFVTCFGFWLLLSGHWAGFDLWAGVAAAALVALHNRGQETLSAAVRVAPRFAVTYLPWLLGEIVKANLEVARIVLSPRLPIDPVIVRHTTALRTPLARTTFGNSITLTPGTITLDIEDGTVVVHALTPPPDEALADMAARVGRTFGERSA